MRFHFMGASLCGECLFICFPSQIPLPSKPYWYLLFGASEDEIKEICVTTLRLYARKKVSVANFLPYL